MRLPRLDGGNLTALKWLALAIMTAGHVDWWLYDSALGVHTTVGRIAFPLFAGIFGYNIARPSVTVDRLPGILRRLVVFAALCTPAYAVLAGLLPFGILATIALTVAIIYAHERGREALAALLLVVGPLWVDYGHVGVLLMLSVWASYRFHPAWLLGVAASLGLLCHFNGNAWALLAVPVAGAVLALPSIRLPRTKWAFYVYYLGHVVALAIVALVIR